MNIKHRSPTLMRLQLIQLQQKEVILTKQNGDIQTELNITKKLLENANSQLSELQEKLLSLQVCSLNNNIKYFIVIR